MINQDRFKLVIQQLELHYNKTLTTFVQEAWYAKLGNLSLNDLIAATKKAVCQYEFMPTANQLYELATAEISENHAAYQEPKALLPSAELRMTDEERLANIQKLNRMIKDSFKPNFLDSTRENENGSDPTV